MEQEPRSPELRERAVSSEPSSIRPNPFAEGDHSSRKRRRTSQADSRSLSVETEQSQGQPGAAVASDVIMMIDTPDPVTPSPQAESDPATGPTATEPHSSQVTLNLRKAGSLEATPTSPTSPTKSRSRADDIKASVEESEVRMRRGTLAEDDVPPTVLPHESHSDILDASLDGDEDDDISLADPQASILSMAGNGGLDINAIMLTFPYHTVDESYLDTINRLVQYFQQQPTQFEEVLACLTQWLDRYLSYCRSAALPAVLESYQENRQFWQSMYDLFWAVYHRRNSVSKSRSVRELAGQFFIQLPKLTGLFVAIDAITIQRVSTDTTLNDLELTSPEFLKCLGLMTMPLDANQTLNGFPESAIPDLTELLDIFQQVSGGSIQRLYRFAELQTTLLRRFPRKILESLSCICYLADSIVSESRNRLAFSPNSSNGLTAQCRKNLNFGLMLFQTVSEALTVAVDKYVNHLNGDGLVNSLSSILKNSLQGMGHDGLQQAEDFRRSHPEVPEHFVAEAIAYTWRFELLSKLIRSRQMQLRVVAVGTMCNDLVGLWKEHDTSPLKSEQHLDYLRYISGFLSRNGLVDYILGPTCHPEITTESFNIVGFLIVTNTYSHAHTDLFWQTMTSTQNPRVAEGLVRMLTKILMLMSSEDLNHLCEKLHGLPIDGFTPWMRELIDTLIKQMHTKCMHDPIGIPLTPYTLCLRLLQEASSCGPQGLVAYPEIHSFAGVKLRDLLHYGPSDEVRQELLSRCLQDIANKSATSSGSLYALYVIIRQSMNRDLTVLITEHDFVRLLVDELEATISMAREAGFSSVYAHPSSVARRELISCTIGDHGEAINSEQGLRLWSLLVGGGALCRDDRVAAWQSLNAAFRQSHLTNPFLKACLREYLPSLAPSYYSTGALTFVREAIVPLANDTNSIILDEGEGAEDGPMELLWKMILTTPDQGLEKQAISILINDIYVESKSIVSFPLHRARKVHFGLVNRCLRQLAEAAHILRTFNDGTVSGDDDQMVLSAPDDQQTAQELKFIRSLSVLRVFLRTLQGKSHFAAPDVRSLMLQSPCVMEGDSAELKFQSFDGDKQTEVKPLNIGRQNTAASLLASIKEATGFENYRIFYRGAPLTPTEEQICKSLEDLDIHDGLILVKKEVNPTTSPVKIKPGASPLDIEILGHFKELWEYLSMEEKLAKEIYAFLVKLPADESVLEAFEDTSISHRDIFPLGQPFKSLYAIHALREFLSTRRLRTQVVSVSTQDADSKHETVRDHHDALLRAICLIVAAICDPAVVERCPSEALRNKLSFTLVDNFVQLLKGEHTDLFRNGWPFAADFQSESSTVTPDDRILSVELQDRLLQILGTAIASPASQNTHDLINRSFEALLECCARSVHFWTELRQKSEVKMLIQTLLLTDDRRSVRESALKQINSKIYSDHNQFGVPGLEFAEVFWPMVFELLPSAVQQPEQCEEIFNLSSHLVKKLSEANSPVLDLQSCLARCMDLLLAHTTEEDITHPERVDIVTHGLILILHQGVSHLREKKEQVEFSLECLRGVFHKHLFPDEDDGGPLIPRALFHTPSRHMLWEIILTAIRGIPGHYQALLQDLDALTPYDRTVNAEPYKYELPQLFDRSKAVRSPCGYSGLRNLSNTCYLNSLFTQLFMNAGFRQFILQARVSDPAMNALLAETQLLFASLQDSVRRFVDPQYCVAQITTYEETPIDIHNQMDVDEFYNLLFDRWEAQLSTDSAKKALRSIYGGQLVQQVKSQECEHISERMEPFSAIQCDIKGKANLEESLQAYVDGEIMEGDNKYKCETCDRHVDAVKRACLKDIPDNLIFHLKRFDFNLRTLQRSKINDYFPFPQKIDMQPYTIEHLSDPSREAEPDMFELVGVLVHSGTAESGHYYSFIRERPSSNSSDSWIEFNDETVSAWDPSKMEHCCYGGQDYRQSFDNPAMYEKVYSAYMLFYQRSSSLKKEQERLEVLGKPSPIRADVPPDIECRIKADNWALVQRHVLNDPTHIAFVQKFLQQTWDRKCSDNHKVENLAMRVALGHLDQVASREKDSPDFEALYGAVVGVCRRCPRCCLALFDYFRGQPEALRMLLQRNADAAIRQETGSLLIYTLNSIKTAYTDEYHFWHDDWYVRAGNPNESKSKPGTNAKNPSIVAQAVTLFAVLWSTFQTTLRAWPEYFGTMAEFASFGRIEAAAFLDQDFLVKLVKIIAADPVLDLDIQYARMMTAINRRTATRPASYDSIIALLSVLLNVMDPIADPGRFVEEPSGRLGLALETKEPIPFTPEEVNTIHQDWGKNQPNIFVEKLIQINQNPVATDSIIERLMHFSTVMDRRIYLTLRNAITGQLVTYSVAPYLRAAITYVLASSNSDNVRSLIAHISHQCSFLHSTEAMAFLDFQKAVFDKPRQTQEDPGEVLLESLSFLRVWVPGLLGSIDQNASYALELFLQEVLFQHGSSPSFEEDEGGIERAQAIVLATRQLAIHCLLYLQDTYVARGLQAPRETVTPIERVIRHCEPYFSLNDPAEDGLDAQFVDLCHAVLEPMGQLTVDEIEEDGSDWEESSGTSERMDSLADLSIPVTGEPNDGELQ